MTTVCKSSGQNVINVWVGKKIPDPSFITSLAARTCKKNAPKGQFFVTDKKQYTNLDIHHRQAGDLAIPVPKNITFHDIKEFDDLAKTPSEMVITHQLKTDLIRKQYISAADAIRLLALNYPLGADTKEQSIDSVYIDLRRLRNSDSGRIEAIRKDKKDAQMQWRQSKTHDQIDNQRQLKAFEMRGVHFTSGNSLPEIFTAGWAAATSGKDKLKKALDYMAARATIAHNTQFDAGDTAWEVALPEDNVQKSLWKRKFFQDTKRTITDISEELKRYNPSSIADAFKMLFSQDKENNFHSRYNQELCWFITDKESVEAQLKEKQIFARTGFVFADATDRTINYQENSGKINADIASKLDAHSNPIIEQLLDGASVDLPYKGEWVLHNPERKSKDDSVLV